MKKYLWLFWVCAFFGCNEAQKRLPYYDTPEFTPKWLASAGKNFHKIRPFQLVHHQNQPFTEKDMEGKICVVDFFFATCPGICPKMTKNMALLQKEFLQDEDILLLSHTVTPEKDNVANLNAYAQEKKVVFNRWKLLTGEKKEIYDLGRKYYFVEEDEGINKGTETFLHTENFVLIDKNRHIRGIYNGIEAHSLADLIRDMRILKSERVKE